MKQLERKHRKAKVIYIVLRTRGPIEVITLNEERVVADGRYVLARTEGLKYRVRRAARSPIVSLLSGERRLRVYEGKGKVLLSSLLALSAVG